MPHVTKTQSHRKFALDAPIFVVIMPVAGRKELLATLVEQMHMVLTVITMNILVTRAVEALVFLGVVEEVLGNVR